MRVTPTTRAQLRLANAVFILLFLGAVGLLQWLSRDYHLQFDWTQNARHSLSQASIAVLERLEQPVRIQAFASTRQGQRRAIAEMIGRYQKHKSDIQLEFVDPDTDPDAVREAGVRYDGEVVIHYGDAKEQLTQLTEENITNALTRLDHRGERWLVFLSGHGERSPDRQANFDLSVWAQELGKRGFKTRSLSLSENPTVPENTTALVIAGPRTNLLDGEVEVIRKYVENGGNLLWLADPGGLHGLASLAEALGVELQPGVVIDPASQLITGNASAIAITGYNNNAIVKDFSTVTLFPTASALHLQSVEGWTQSVLLDTRPSAWSETGSLKGKVDFDKGRDIPGPLTIAATLTRQLPDKGEQRVVVFGDGDFLSNTYIGNGGNLDLGLSVVNWLSRDDDYVSIPVHTATDRNLDLSERGQFIIALLFMIVLPLGLAGSGVTIWLRRRKR